MIDEKKLLDFRIEQLATSYVSSHDDVSNMGINEYVQRIVNVKSDIEDYLNRNDLLK